MAKHVLYFPASYTALIYGLLTIPGLLLALYVGLAKDSKKLLENACGKDHYEFWPSISSAIGDMIPERQLWRIAFVLCTPFRLGASVSLFYVFFQKSCKGMSDINGFLFSPRQLVTSSAFLCLVMLWADLWRLISAAIWTMVSSTESLPYHNLGFGPYIALCFLLQVVITTLTRRNLFNMSIYASQRDAQVSYKLKKLFMIVEFIASLGVVVFYFNHKATCLPGSYSLSTLCEWTFAMSNVLYDMTGWYELRLDGWWLSGSPSFYRQLIANHKGGDKHAAAQYDAASGQMGTEDHPTHRQPQNMTPETVQVPMPSLEDPINHSKHPAAAASSSHAGAETLFDDEIVVHTFTICSAPSNIQLWLCDIYWAHLLFEMMIHVVEHMYFQPLIAMSLSWEVITILVFGTPMLLRFAPFRRWATAPCPFARTLLKPANPAIGMSYRLAPKYVMFFFLASFSHLHLLIQDNARQKILGVSVGPFFVLLGMVCRYLYPSTTSAKFSTDEDCRRMMYAFPLALVLGMLLRVLHITVSPIFVDPLYAAVFGIALGISFTVCLYREAMFSKEEAPEEGVQHLSMGKSENVEGGPNAHTGEDTPTRRVQFSLAQNTNKTGSITALATSCYTPSSFTIGMLMGLVVSLSMNFFTCANYIPRLLAVEPYPASLVVIAVFSLGLYFSPDVIPISPISMQHGRQHSPLSPHRVLQALFKSSMVRFGAVMMTGVLIMLFGTRQTNFTYEVPHKGYPVTFSTPKEDVKIEHWRAQMDFSGNKYFAFCGALVLTFCFGALYPVAMELALAHQRIRRLALLANAVDTESVYRKESNVLMSFEMAWFIVSIVSSVVYALVISYPFVPMAWLVREQSRPLMFSHTLSIVLITAYLVGKCRRAKPDMSDNRSGYQQRAMHTFVSFLVVVAFLFVIIGRGVLQPDDVSFPAGKKTAIQYQHEVLRIHDMMVELRKERNIITDVTKKDYEVAYHLATYEDAMDDMERNITAAKSDTVDEKYELRHLPQNVRRGIFDCAKAMTFFSGMIWTVHFALDNYNVDSLSRMVHHARQTEAGVVGLLESDSMHVTNGNRDMVEYMSYYLGYRYTDYGPTVLDNTYGCGMISRYPILKVHRYVMPSPLGELACVIHAELDVFGVAVHTYVGHFGNTEHFADGLLQSQFVGSLVTSNPGPSLWLGYLVTHPGDADHYRQYTEPGVRGKFRDTALEIYKRPWERIKNRGGYEEEPPLTVTTSPDDAVDFNVEYKLTLNGLKNLESGMSVDRSFRRTPPGKDLRHFYYPQTNRYSTAHPRFELIDRYCQYNLYKTGAEADELPEHAGKLQPYTVELFDWWRQVDGGVQDLSDTEIQVTQLRFRRRTN